MRFFGETVEEGILVPYAKQVRTVFAHGQPRYFFRATATLR